MLTRRDKDILRAILTLTASKVNPGVRRIGRVTTPPLSHNQVAKDVQRLIDRGLLVREARQHGTGSSFRLSREAVAMLQAAGVVPRVPTMDDVRGLVLVDPVPPLDE